MGNEAEYLDDAGDYYADKYFYERELKTSFRPQRARQSKRKGVNMEIVSVQFQSKNDKEEYTGREYSYIAGVPLKLGDIVAVPTKNGIGVAKVTKVNLRASDVGCPLSVLKKIDTLVENTPADEIAADTKPAGEYPAPTF